MSAITDFVEMEIQLHYVSVSWVAKHYGVPRQWVYRAIAAKRLRTIRARGPVILLDARTLPKEFPRR